MSAAVFTAFTASTTASRAACFTVSATAACTMFVTSEACTPAEADAIAAAAKTFVDAPSAMTMAFVVPDATSAATTLATPFETV